MINVSGARERALATAARGYHVFPVKVKIVDRHKIVHPIAKWREAGTRDPATIEAWWAPGSPWESAWPAVDCGRSGVVVIDLDVCDGDGPDGIEAWRALPGIVPYPHAYVTTPSGGRHLAYKADPARVVGIDNTGKVARWVDVRGDGGFAFIYGWLAAPRDLPPLPEIVHERMGRPPARPRGGVPVATGATDAAPVRDVFDTPGREFTDEQAAEFVAGPLRALAGAKVGTINGRCNATAVTLAHFVPAFWSAEEAMRMLSEALAQTVYDGRTWKASRFRTILDGSEVVADGWKAVRVDPEAPGPQRGAGPAPGGTDGAGGPGVEPGRAEGEGSAKPSSAFFTDARMADLLGAATLRRRFVWTPGQGWLSWTGTHWHGCDDSLPREALRKAVIERYDRELARVGSDPDRGHDVLDGWRRVMSKDRINAVLLLTRGIAGIRMDDLALDRDRDLLNTPAGIVDLRTGETGPHDPARLMTRITSGSYRPGYEHEDWAKALEAVTPDALEWLQMRVGQAATGHAWPHADAVILQGNGNNGKSAITTDGVLPALGGYGLAASAKLLLADEHSTERADLRGARMVVCEEQREGQTLDMTALKQIQDVGLITARKLYRENVTFRASHSLFMTTNPVPVIVETDKGAWRRVSLLRFTTTFLLPHEVPASPRDRPGDVGLKPRIKEGADGQHDAIITWAVEGARRWYADPSRGATQPASVDLDTMTWRMDTDRVMRYVAERLVRDDRACVLRAELHEDFNAWLHGLGHAPWSVATFRGRFVQHQSVAGWQVREQQTRDLEHLSRRFVDTSATCAPVARVWRGFRFRTERDETAESGMPGLDGFIA